MNSLIENPPKPFRIVKRPPAPKNRPAIEDSRGGWCLLRPTQNRKPNERANGFSRKPAHAVPNWQAPTSTEKPAGHRGVARWRVLGWALLLKRVHRPPFLRVFAFFWANLEIPRARSPGHDAARCTRNTRENANFYLLPLPGTSSAVTESRKKETLAEYVCLCPWKRKRVLLV